MFNPFSGAEKKRVKTLKYDNFDELELPDVDAFTAIVEDAIQVQRVPDVELEGEDVEDEEYPDEVDDVEDEEYPDEAEEDQGYEGQLTEENVDEYEEKCRDHLRCKKEECEVVDKIILELINEKERTGKDIDMHSEEVKKIQDHIDKCHADLGKCNKHIEFLNERLETIAEKLDEVRTKKEEIKRRISEMKEEERYLNEIKREIQKQKNFAQALN